MTNHMFIVTSFRTRYNEEKEYYEITSSDVPACPYCEGVLEYRNSRQRGVQDEQRNEIMYLLRRFRCEGCRHLHTELPSFIQPYKHYSSSVIQDVLDGGGNTCAADDSTLRRWRSDFSDAGSDIEQRLLSCYAQESGAHPPISRSVSLLEWLRGREPMWLAFVMKLLLSRGYRLCTRFAFCPYIAADKVHSISKSYTKGEEINDKTINDTG